MGDERPAPVGPEEPSFGSLLHWLRLRARLTQEVLALTLTLPGPDGWA